MKILKWIKRIFLGLLSLVILALIVGFCYERMARAKVNEQFQPTGQLVDLGDHQLHALIKGEGGPTVVFESGLDLGGHLTWDKVQEQISQQTTTISYDRAGVLWSERGDNPKTNAAMSAELHDLLEKTECPKPYILVGHSLAGLTLRPFIDQNKEDISGIIFVDVSHPDQGNRVPQLLEPNLPPKWILKLVFEIGIGRMIAQNQYPNTQKQDTMNLISNAFQYKSMTGALDEIENLNDLLFEASHITNFDSIPLAVLTGTSPGRNKIMPDKNLRAKMDQIWPELQKDLLNLSSKSEHVLAPQSGHYIQLEQPEIVIGSIEKMIQVERDKAKSEE